MDLANFLIQLLNGVQYGLLLFMLAAGLTLIFGIMGVVNLAHGSFYMLGAYLAWWLAGRTGSLLLAIVLGTLLSVAFGLLLERILFRHFYRRDHLDQVLLTFGLIYIFEELRSIAWGDDVHGVPMTRRTESSGRQRQASSAAMGMVRATVSAPFVAWQRGHPDRGPGIVASGRVLGA